ncbi:MAG: hypothetical protein WAK57_16935 [Desulfobacterales bacterium]
MSLPPKELRCRCGNTFVTDKKKTWCTQCMQPVFYDPKEQRANRLSNWYFFVTVILVVGFLSYIFIELIMVPFLTVPK